MAMRDHLLFIGVPPANIHIRTLLPPVDWEQHHRIELLADMRNAGMKPFYDTLPAGLSPDGKPWTGIIWYNDVYLSASHFLEIMHQHMSQGADMTCGWDHAGKWFYDGWVGRDMAGDLYTPFPVREEDQDLPQKVRSSPSRRMSNATENALSLPSVIEVPLSWSVSPARRKRGSPTAPVTPAFAPSLPADTDSP
jgi:hypothetical protein